MHELESDASKRKRRSFRLLRHRQILNLLSSARLLCQLKNPVLPVHPRQRAFTRVLAGTTKTRAVIQRRNLPFFFFSQRTTQPHFPPFLEPNTLHYSVLLDARSIDQISGFPVQLHLSQPINNMVEKLTVEECQAHIRDIRVSHGADARNESERFLRRGYESMLKL